MTTQPEALRLADAMTRALEQTDAEDDVVHVARWFVEDSRAELRRLHALNGELLEALERLVVERKAGLASLAAWDQARAAIARAEGEQT